MQDEKGTRQKENHIRLTRIIQPSQIVVLLIMSDTKVSTATVSSSRSVGCSGSRISLPKDRLELSDTDTEDSSASSSSMDLTTTLKVRIDLKQNAYHATKSFKSELRKHWYDPKALSKFRNESLLAAAKLALCKSRRSWMLKRISKSDLLIPLAHEYKKCASVKNERDVFLIEGSNTAASSPVDRNKLKALYSNFEHFSGLERIIYRATRGHPSKNVALILKYAHMKCAQGGHPETAFFKMSRAASRSSRILARELAMAHAAAVSDI